MEDEIDSSEYESKHAFLEYYLNVPVCGAFTTYDMDALPAQYRNKLSLERNIDEAERQEKEQPARSMEVVGMLSGFMQDLADIKR
jgi:hypothetical protein